MAKKKYDSENGVWRTIGGRRVFIRKGQDLSSAMKESGKFKTKMNEKAVKGAREEDLKDQYIESLNNVSKMEYNGEITRDEYDEAIKNINKEYKNRKMGDKFYTKKDETREYELYKRAKENPDSIDPMTENSTDWEALDKKYASRYKTEKIREQISQPVEYNYKSENLKEFSKRDIRDAYESKVFGSDVTKADEQMKKTFGEDFKYDEEKYGIGDNVKYEDGVTGKVVSKPTNGRMTVEWEDGTKNTYSENHPGIKKDTRVSRNSDKYTSEEYTGDISDLKARHTGQYIQNYKDEANEKIRNVLTGKSRADKSLEKYGLRVERDNSAQKEFGKRYFGKNVDIVDEKTGRMIHSSYDNYYDWDNSINAKPSVNSQDGKEWHTIKSGRYSKERKNVTNEFNYYDYLKKPNNDYKENSLGEKVAQFRKDKEYLKQHEYEIKRANEVANRYMKTKYELDEYKERKSAKPDYDHFAGWELYSDDPNRFGDKIRKYNEKMFKEQEESARRVEERYLKERYRGTYEYLKNTKNISGAEILELLKKIDEDKK